MGKILRTPMQNFSYIIVISYRIVLKFRGSLISRISRIWNDSQIISTKVFTLPLCIDSRVHVHVRSGNLDPRYCPSTLLKYRKHRQARYFCGKQCEVAICQCEGQGACLKNEREEGRNGKASGRACIASHLFATKALTKASCKYNLCA